MSLVSVVIPSLGHDNLLNTVEKLNSGTVKPDEILICLPTGTLLSFNVPDNTSVLYCEKRSQVAQRALGFKTAISTYVMQLDDDTLLETDCLEKLLKAIKKERKKCAVAPKILDSVTGESIYKREYNNTLFSKIRYFIANGKDMYKPGTITKAGTCFGPNYSGCEGTIVEVEWLAGCCVLHGRENILYDDYYPFRGKAYCEDLISSYLYKKNNVNYYIVKDASCYTVPAAPYSGSITELVSEQRVRSYYMTISGKQRWHYYIYASFRYLFEFIVNYPLRLIHKLYK